VVKEDAIKMLKDYGTHLEGKIGVYNETDLKNCGDKYHINLVKRKDKHSTLDMIFILPRLIEPFSLEMTSILKLWNSVKKKCQKQS